MEKICVVGLGYVGLPVALAFARKFPGTVGFDISHERVRELRDGFDRNYETPLEELHDSTLKITDDPQEIDVNTTFFVVAVPTPVDRNNAPDLTPVEQASRIVGRSLKPGAVVVYESTVYPGVTEDICAPILARESDLKRHEFKLGYSPERINPGDKDHTLENVVKVVSGEDQETLERVDAAYSQIVQKTHRAQSIKVAEAAKVIENTQRDINIALMNELALIFDRMGIRTQDVLAAAGTKWNFARFKPGLVGGHCIGVDPYYLTSKAQELGYQPEMILAGRRINNSVGPYVAQRLVKMLISAGATVRGARVGILGLTFKENCNDLRNSKVPGLVKELRSFGIHAMVHDPVANPREAMREYGEHLYGLEDLAELDGLVLAVAHRQYLDMEDSLIARVRDGGAIADVKSALHPEKIGRKIAYWSL